MSSQDSVKSIEIKETIYGLLLLVPKFQPNYRPLPGHDVERMFDSLLGDRHNLVRKLKIVSPKNKKRFDDY